MRLFFFFSQFGPEHFKQLQTHGQGKKRNPNQNKEAFCWHSASGRLLFVCKAQALKLQMLKSKFSGLGSNIIYKAQISLFTRHLERKAVN